MLDCFHQLQWTYQWYQLVLNQHIALRGVGYHRPFFDYPLILKTAVVFYTSPNTSKFNARYIPQQVQIYVKVECQHAVLIHATISKK